MSLSQSFEQNPFTASQESAPLFSLLERGLILMRQGCSVEGIALLAQAREQLLSDQVDLSIALNTLIQGHGTLWKAQQELHQACKRFVEADNQQQISLSALEALLTTRRRELEPSPSTDSITYHCPPLLVSTSAPTKEGTDRFSIYIRCFGHFEVRRHDQSVVVCNNHNGLKVLRYLIARPNHCALAEVLMTLLWPDDEPEVARHKLQVAISALRHALNGDRTGSISRNYVLYKNQTYQLHPATLFHLDIDEFLALYQAGCRAEGDEAVSCYEKACQLYIGPFLMEDLYEDWSSLRREQLSKIYLEMCHSLAEHYLVARCFSRAAEWAMKLLDENRYDEPAYRLLMRAYAGEARRHDAIRQFQRCQQVLFEELGVQPMPETISLFHTILNGE